MAEEMFLSGIMAPFVRLIILFGLQIFLCRCRNKWFGLVLPAFYLGQSVYFLAQTIISGILAEYGLLGQILFAFVLPNVNTVVLLLIYYFTRSDKPAEQ